MKEKLTKERALELHRRMWSDMRAELGNNPDGFDRRKFKEKWCAEHNFKDVMAHCFLCEYDEQENGDCSDCLIDWSPLSGSPQASHCYSGYRDENNWWRVIWRSAPIDEILNLPEKEGV